MARTRYSRLLRILAISTFPLLPLCAKSQEWEGRVRVQASNTDVEYAAENRFGVKNNATRNYNFGIDILAPPPQPSGVNTYQRTDDNVAVIRNYISTADENLSFRGVIQYNNFAPTSASLHLTNLPSTTWALMTFTDAAHTQLANSYAVTDGQVIELSPNIRSYIITQRPEFTDIVAQQSAGNTSFTLQARFYCYDAVKLEVQTTPLVPGSFTPLGDVMLSNGNGIFNGISASPSRFYRLKPVQK